MSASKVLGLSEDTASMTFAQARAFIERTRRQVDRFDALPRAPGQNIAPEDAADIRRQCDELEASLSQSLSIT